MSDFTSNSIVIISISIFLLIFFSRKVRTAQIWRATVTPLASIIGSGFLVSAPLMILTTGKWAALAMLGVVTIAYFLGSVMRFNILYLEPLLTQTSRTSFMTHFEGLSRLALAIAYMISVAFYLKLLSVFFLKGLNLDHNLIMQNTLTTLILIFIGLVGWFKGFAVLETLEEYAVNLKLTIIGAMIVGNLFYNITVFTEGDWFIAVHQHAGPFETFQKLLGVLIIVQGFETSRYLGEIYSAKVRIKTMRYSQIISGTIYVVFVGSAMLLLNGINQIRETVLIDMCRLVAPILPALLVFAAVMSQFSAAVADSIGSSGLISETTHKIINIKKGILLTVTIAIGLVWITNIYEIIVIASKAFAIYYGIQCLIAAMIAYKRKHRLKYISFIILFILMTLVVILGVSAN